MASSITSFSEPQDRSLGKNARTEAGVNIDKFATLFSPATPRPSPTLDPIILDSDPMPYPRSFHHRETSASDAEFSAFVSVLPTEDPLSALDFVLPSSTKASPSPLDANDKDRNRKNSSLRFFGKFTQEAKEAAERNKRGVLDELLLHEDDPLYWLKEEQPTSGSNHLSRPSSSSPSPSPKLEAEASVPVRSDEGPETDSDASNSLLDLDHDFFASKPIQASPSSSPSHAHGSTSAVHHSPSRSPTQPAPVTLALPIANTSAASSNPAGEPSDPLTHNTAPEEHTTRRSHSYHTLSSRWMSSLLSSKPGSANLSSPDASSSSGHRGSPPLESLFHTEASSTATHKPRSRSTEQRPSAGRHANTQPPLSDARISHGTPFGHHSRSSPFGPHLYVPPTGAPGFAGERYDWDRGFSADLRLEMERDREHDGGGAGERGRQEREMIHVGRGGSGSRGGSLQGRAPGGGGGREPAEGVVGVGEFMEKKSGRVQLDGRKAMTTPVLGVALADMVRCIRGRAPSTLILYTVCRSGTTSRRWPASRGNGPCCTPSTSTASP